MTGSPLPNQYSADATVQNASSIPVNSTAPTIYPPGPVPQGTVLICVPGTWSNSPSNYIYSWAYDTPSSVNGIGTGATYTVGPCDAGCTLTVSVIAVNQYGQSSSATTSAGSGTVAGSGGGTDIGAMVSTGFTTPSNYTSLVNSWNFSSGLLVWGAGNTLPQWSVIADSGNNYSPGSLEYTLSQAIPTPYGCQLAAATDSNPSFDYQSGLITTRDHVSYRYGRFRFTVQMPSCDNPTGLWPACWMLTDPAGGASSVEIDVVEMNMQYPSTVNGTLHGAYGAQIQTGTGSVSNASSSFNIYEVIWEPGMVTWGVNNVAYEQYIGTDADAAFNMYLLVNNGMSVSPYAIFGGSWDSTYDYELPAAMYVLAVQVYG